MLKRAAVALVTSCCCLAPEARADWQYTRWGMSLQELLGADQGIVKTTTAVQEDRAYGFGKPMASGHYEAMGTEFSVDFLFDSDKLSGVALYMDSSDAAARINAALGDQYGKPDESTSEFDPTTECQTDYRRWRDLQAGNVIAFRSWTCVGTNAPSDYHVIYRPILRAESTGL